MWQMARSLSISGINFAVARDRTEKAGEGRDERERERGRE